MHQERKQSKFDLKSFFIGIGLVAGSLLFIRAQPSDNYFEISKNLDIFTNIFKELNDAYVDPIEPGGMVKSGIDAMLEGLDPYTNYITEADIEDFEFMTTGKYGGIGATMRRKGDDIYVGEIYENSPAQLAGLRPGDMLISIDNNLVHGKTIDDISIWLKGAPGTQLNMKVRDPFTGEENSRMITRGEIELSSVPYAGLVGPQKDIALVKLTQFTVGCSRQVRKSLDSLKAVSPGLKGVVLDLRNNPGGLLDEAVNICNLFVDRGQLIVSTKGKSPQWNSDFKTQMQAWDLKIPVAVLINRMSASASEIVSGTMQDLDRGIVIGSRSYGKGLVQTTRAVGYNARLKLTTARYFTPSGRCIQEIEYGHRDNEGKASKLPDSLRQSYKTKSGRSVQSGGGVEPDVKTNSDEISKLSVALYAKNYFFDYATSYVRQHKTIDPAGTFALSDGDFGAFVKWLEGKDYAYKTDTEIMLDSLNSVAEEEQYLAAIKSDIGTLRSKLSHDKKQDLNKFRGEILRLLEGEIVSRYYYNRGRIENSLKYDDEIKKAVSLILNSSEYGALLKPKG